MNTPPSTRSRCSAHSAHINGCSTFLCTISAMFSRSPRSRRPPDILLLDQPHLRYLIAASVAALARLPIPRQREISASRLLPRNVELDRPVGDRFLAVGMNLRPIVRQQPDFPSRAVACI